MTTFDSEPPIEDPKADRVEEIDPVKQALARLNNSEKKEQADACVASGQLLFERGRYKKAIANFQTALALSNPMGARGGEIQMWLVNAYIASGNEAEGLALCRKLIVHPDLDTKQQSKRMLYILEAPELEMKPEWVTKIPSLDDFDDDKKVRYAQRPKKKRRRKAKPEPEPIDLSQVNTADNQFVWIALIGVILTLGGLVWLS
ncbi:MAG: tetratricopeptide repeat protein [Cyanobacteria bacterium J06560_2]